MANISFSSFVLDPGEGTKSWAGLARLTEWLIGEGVERGDHVIALGGGVIGDLVGFACSIVKRGCNFVQVPTTDRRRRFFRLVRSEWRGLARGRQRGTA